MPLYRLPGVSGPQDVHIPDAAEIAHAIGEQQRAAITGWKRLDMPLSLTGTVSGAAITLGVSKGQVLGPESGYTWSIRRLLVSGLATGTTPDVVNFYKNDRFSGPPLWQLNGNSFGQTFGFGHIVIKGGETIGLQNVGNLAATGVITVSGEVDEMPSEKYYAGGRA